MPAVLLEAGSIINRDEELELRFPERRALISESAVATSPSLCAARVARAGRLRVWRASGPAGAVLRRHAVLRLATSARAAAARAARYQRTRVESLKARLNLSSSRRNSSRSVRRERRQIARLRPPRRFGEAREHAGTARA